MTATTATATAATAVTARRAYRTPPTVPRPRSVALPDGRRGRREPVTYLPGPPPGRPRFAHQRLAEEHNGARGITFRTYADGHVVEYGRTGTDPVAHRDWVVLVWTAHPLLSRRHPRLERVIIDHATYHDALVALDAWELTGEVS